MNHETRLFAVAALAGLHVLAMVFTLNTQPYASIPKELALRLDRVVSTGTSASAEMIFFFLVGSAFYLGYLILLFRVGSDDESNVYLFTVGIAAVLINTILIDKVRIGGDVVRSISFAAAFLKGYNPYSIDGYQLNGLIQSGKVAAPLVTEYLDHRFDYPSVALFYYSAILFLAGSVQKAYVHILIGLTAARFGAGFLIYRICRANRFSYVLPVTLFWMNPIMIYTSYDGKDEALMIAFALISMYLLEKARPAFSGAFLALSTLAKYVSVIYWPVLVLYRRKSTPVTLSLAYAAVILGLSTPFLLTSPYVFWGVGAWLSRPCNSYLNLFCYDPSHPLSLGREIAAVAYASIFAFMAFSFRKEKGFSRMTVALTTTTLIAIIFTRGFFIWYLDWLSVSVYFAQKAKTLHYLLPVILPLVASPSLLGP